MMITTTRVALAGSTLAFVAFVEFLATPVSTPVGVLIGLAVLPTSELALASSAVLDSVRDRVEPSSRSSSRTVRFDENQSSDRSSDREKREIE